MEQEHKDITAPQIYETSIGLVGMSKTEYAMYQEEMEKRVGNLHIYVDADACPVIRIVEKIAEKYTIPVTLLCDTNHVLESDYSEVIVVGAGTDAIHQSGKWYTNENIDQMLMERHLNKKARRSSHKNHMKGPRKRTEEDDVRFAQSFEKLIQMAKSKEGAQSGTI